MGLDEFNAIAKSYGLPDAVLIVGCFVLLYAVRKLYRENQTLHSRLEDLSYERVKALEALLDENAPKGAEAPHA